METTNVLILWGNCICAHVRLYNKMTPVTSAPIFKHFKRCFQFASLLPCTLFLKSSLNKSVHKKLCVLSRKCVTFNQVLRRFKYICSVIALLTASESVMQEQGNAQQSTVVSF